jgi:hypothetical protein
MALSVKEILATKHEGNSVYFYLKPSILNKHDRLFVSGRKAQKENIIANILDYKLSTFS